MNLRLVAGAMLVAACGLSAAPPAIPSLALPADTVWFQEIQPGVRYWYQHRPVGPWGIHLLAVDLDRCYAGRAVKAGRGALGRGRTSTLLADLAKSQPVVGGVNGDFFLFSPPGVPAGAMVTQGRIVTGPSSQPVFGWDAEGRPFIGVLRVRGSLSVGGQTLRFESWNRPSRGLGGFDPNWGPSTDSVSGTVEAVIRGLRPARVILVDTATAGVAVPEDGAVLVAGPAAPDAQAVLRRLHPGDSLEVAVALNPHPREAVGGRPVLVRDSTIVPDVDTTGQPGFATGRHPRTAVGIARGGTRLLLVVVDGRQRPYSDGMTLRELAELLRGLGAREALNLDGGGSSTLVLADPDSAGRLRVANRPSDPTGERPVGNVLAVVKDCPWATAPRSAPRSERSPRRRFPPTGAPGSASGRYRCELGSPPGRTRTGAGTPLDSACR